MGIFIKKTNRKITKIWRFCWKTIAIIAIHGDSNCNSNGDLGYLGIMVILSWNNIMWLYDVTYMWKISSNITISDPPGIVFLSEFVDWVFQPWI